MSAAPFSVRLTDWQRDATALRAVREAVFVVEQSIPASLEWDAADYASVHALAQDASGHPLGCARLLADGHVGRVAVLREWRRRGVGNALMTAIIADARARGHARLVLHSQVHACAFYARLGFAPSGGVFDEAAIAHQAMVMSLQCPVP